MRRESGPNVKAIAPTDFGAARALLAITPKSVGHQNVHKYESNNMEVCYVATQGFGCRASDSAVNAFLLWAVTSSVANMTFTAHSSMYLTNVKKNHSFQRWKSFQSVVKRVEYILLKICHLKLSKK